MMIKSIRSVRLWRILCRDTVWTKGPYGDLANLQPLFVAGDVDLSRAGYPSSFILKDALLPSPQQRSLVRPATTALRYSRGVAHQAQTGSRSLRRLEADQQSLGHDAVHGKELVKQLTQPVCRNEPNFLDAGLFRSSVVLFEQCLDLRTGKSILVALMSRQVLPATATETAPCGLRRSNASRANRIWLTWRHRIASYWLSRSSVKLGKLARRKKQRARSAVGSMGSGLELATVFVSVVMPCDARSRSRSGQPERTSRKRCFASPGEFGGPA